MSLYTAAYETFIKVAYAAVKKPTRFRVTRCQFEFIKERGELAQAALFLLYDVSSLFYKISITEGIQLAIPVSVVSFRRRAAAVQEANGIKGYCLSILLG